MRTALVGEVEFGLYRLFGQVERGIVDDDDLRGIYRNISAIKAKARAPVDCMAADDLRDWPEAAE